MSDLQEKQEIGQVVGIKDGQVVVHFERQAACRGCKACGMADNNRMEMRLPDPGNLRVGDRVRMELDTQHYYRSALLLYALPLAALILGVAIGASLFSELVGAFMGLGFSALTYLILHQFEPRFRQQNRTKIHLTPVVGVEEE